MSAKRMKLEEEGYRSCYNGIAETRDTVLKRRKWHERKIKVNEDHYKNPLLQLIVAHIRKLLIENGTPRSRCKHKYEVELDIFLFTTIAYGYYDTCKGVHKYFQSPSILENLFKAISFDDILRESVSLSSISQSNLTAFTSVNREHQSAKTVIQPTPITALPIRDEGIDNRNIPGFRIPQHNEQTQTALRDAAQALKEDNFGGLFKLNPDVYSISSYRPAGYEIRGSTAPNVAYCTLSTKNQTESRRDLTVLILASFGIPIDNKPSSTQNGDRADVSVNLDEVDISVFKRWIIAWDNQCTCSPNVNN